MRQTAAQVMREALLNEAIRKQRREDEVVGWASNLLLSIAMVIGVILIAIK